MYGVCRAFSGGVGCWRALYPGGAEFAMHTANKLKLVVLDEVSMLAMNPVIFQDVKLSLQLLRYFVRLGQLWRSFLPARLGVVVTSMTGSFSSLAYPDLISLLLFFTSLRVSRHPRDVAVLRLP